MRLSGVMTLAGVVVVGLACSGALEPGALTIVLDADPPEVTNATSVTLAGQVTRSPAEENVVIVVSVTGAGTSLSDTADASNRFSFTVALTQNTQNQIQLSATDESGSTGTPLSVTVVHDGVGPTVAQITPATQTDGVTASEVTVTVSEPVHSIQGSGVVVSRMGTQVPGTVTMSPDSLTFTFTPTVPFVTNAIYTIAAGGFRDALANQETGSGACFITAGAGAAFADPAADDIWVAGSPAATLVPPDLLQIRLARGGGELRGVLRFTTPRTLTSTSTNNLAAAIDFDTDSDGGTGFTTVKDFVFEGVLAPSGAGAESAVWLLLDPANGILPFVIQYTADLEGTITHTVSPDFCGVFVAFGVPETALGLQSNSFRVVGHVEASDASGAYLDPSPETGFHDVTLAPAPGVPGVISSSSGRGWEFSEARALLVFRRAQELLRRLR